MPPSRRKILQAITTAVPVGLAGCMSGGPPQTTDQSPSPGSKETPAPTSTPPKTPESTPPVNSGGLDDFDPSDTYKRLAIGSRDAVKEEFKPHDLRIWNAVGTDQTVAVRILDRLEKTTVHRTDYNMPADEEARITLLTPSKYFVQLWGPVIDAPETLRVACHHFDCNVSSTDIGIFGSGEVRSAIFSTLVACPHPDC